MQQRAQVSEQAELISQRLVFDCMSTQHQDFFPLLSTLFVASVDKQGRPWASVLVGRPGFVHALDEKHLFINNAVPIFSDPLNENLTLKHPLGLLGLEFETRRRNRFSGNLLSYQNNQMEIEITQAFGNCPKYIQSRSLKILEQINNVGQKKDVQRITRFNNDVKQLIQKADTFFIASYYSQADHQGADVSHRGGRPGFVNVENDTMLSFDDFSGNNLYMTLGNLISNPMAGLLFIDFESGDTLQLSCHVEIIETPSAKHARKIRLTLDYGWLIKSALPIKWEFLEYSKFIEGVHGYTS